MIFKVTASEGLWNISGGCGCGPEFCGMRSEIDAESAEDAVKKVLLQRDQEWMYDLSGQWIEVSDKNGRFRYGFSENPRYADFVGDFVFGGKEYAGETTKIFDTGEDALPFVDEEISVSDGEGPLEIYISRFMPDFVIGEMFACLAD